MERTYNLINYFDVYKDEVGCWSVNNQCIEEYDVTLTDDVTGKDICTYLMNKGYLLTNDMRMLTVIDEGDVKEVYQKKDMVPLFAFVANN